MKKILFTLFVIGCIAITNAQTPITDANFQDAINTCLSTNPIDGMCSDSEYGAMPDWDVRNVTDMSNAFEDRDFNADISTWDVSSVTNMYLIFYGASSFNQDIGSWDVSNVTNMDGMFSYASSFNQDISSWDVSKVTDMYALFSGVITFNQNLNNWDVSSVTDMDYMFENTSAFNQDISNWCVSNISSSFNFSINSPLTEENKPVWGTCPVLSIDDQKLTNISIYPNPVDDKLFIQGLSGVSDISIYDVLGKLVLSKTNTSEIDLTNLKKGIYLIKIKDQQKEIIKKLVKN